ncbi:MAG: hypothetical protein RI964_962 [Pseudomonadota bacterium]|jgi:RND family efflux transporter MFP subunit
MKRLREWVLVVGWSVFSVSVQAESPKESSLPASLQIAQVSEVNAPTLQYLDGHVEAVNQSTVSSQTSGVIEKLYYDVDDYVEQGKVIARIRSKNQQAGVQQAQASQNEAKASLAEAQAGLAEARANFTRVSEIYSRRLIPKADYDNAEATLKAAEARVKAVEARMDSANAQATQAGEQLGYTTVVAPYAGIVTKRHVQLGEAVSPGSPIMSGISLEQLRVEVEVPQRLIGVVRAQKQAVVLQDGSDQPLPVKSITFFPYADPTTNAFKVRLDLDTKIQNIFPGMFVKVGFVTGNDKAISIPNAAVVNRSEVTGTYVISADGKPSLRQIRLGKKLDAEHMSVLSGLNAGENVALDPMQATIFLKQQTAGAKPHE